MDYHKFEKQRSILDATTMQCSRVARCYLFQNEVTMAFYCFEQVASFK
jgi:hypothetical protein